MEFIKKYKFELIVVVVCSALSFLYYINTGEVKVIGALIVTLVLGSAVCKSIFTRLRTKFSEKST